jgi:hypothetical protein
LYLLAQTSGAKKYAPFSYFAPTRIDSYNKFNVLKLELWV